MGRIVVCCNLVGKHNLIFFIFVLNAFFSCNDMSDVENPAKMPNTGSDSGRMFVLCEGLFNSNNSTLACIDYNSQTFYADFFKEYGNNRRGLGDTANDMKIHNGQIWIVVNISSQIEVVNALTGKSVRQIPLFNEKNEPRQPRNIIFHNNKAYVCSFDGTVIEINTQTFTEERIVTCGRNPDGITAANNKLYVANSGGLDAANGSGLSYDNTVSVIDLDTFTEIKKIEVGINPQRIAADSEGDIYVVSRGNNANIKARFQRIDSNTDELAESFDDIAAVNFSILNDTAYIYNFDYTNETYWIKTFDCINEKIILEQFIADDTKLDRPFGIYPHPLTGDLFIGDAKTYIDFGTIYCFNRAGKLRYKIEQIGQNPNNFLFYDI